MRTRLTVSLLVLVGLAGLAGCGSTKTTTSSGGTTTPTAAPSGGLAGTAWNLASYQGPDTTTVPAAPKANATLAFDTAGGLSGSTGCNQFGGTYAVDGPKLSITLGPMTMMACAEPLITAQEAAVVKLLPQVTGFATAADQLTLTGSDGAVLLTYSAGLTDLEGTAWKAIGMNNGRGGVETNALTESLTATFGAAGAFTGFGGCNQLGGTYETSGTDGLTITVIDKTTIGCSADILELESQYYAALGQVATYSISGDQLNLRNVDGATQVIYRLAG